MPVAATAGPATAPATRVLILGDSVAQGSTGDWTWRYRLWQHLADPAVGADVDLVGPHDALHDLDTGANTDHRYADPHFDSDHAARWGMAMVALDDPVGDLVDRYSPDVLVETLGVNDLLFWQLDPDRLLARARQLVVDARAADPDVDVVLGTVPQTWLPGAVGYDAGLPALARELDLPGSRVVATAVPDDFTRADTWDGSHPTATGEVKIAATVADALATVGVGRPAVRPLPVVADGPVAVATAVRASPGAGRVSLSWHNPVGLTGSHVWLRDATRGDEWARVGPPAGADDTTRVVDGLVDGHDYDLSLQAFKGTAEAPVFSEVVRVRAGVPPVVPPPTPTATPTPTPTPGPTPTPTPTPTPSPGLALAPAPVAVRVAPRAVVRSGRRVRVSWAAVPGATSYAVVCRWGGRWHAVAGSTGLAATTRPLPPGRRLLVVETRSGATEPIRLPAVTVTLRR